MIEIRPTRHDDQPGLVSLLDSIELFPSDMLPDLLAPFLNEPGTDALWLTCVTQNRVTGFCYAAAEQMTDATWNMLALGVAADLQNQGLGKAIVTHLEQALRSKGARLLIVDSSGTDAFVVTRAFYAAAGYTQEARVRDYWAAGDDKVIFRKVLL